MLKPQFSVLVVALKRKLKPTGNVSDFGFTHFIITTAACTTAIGFHLIFGNFISFRTTVSRQYARGSGKGDRHGQGCDTTTTILATNQEGRVRFESKNQKSRDHDKRRWRCCAGTARHQNTASISVAQHFVLCGREGCQEIL